MNLLSSALALRVAERHGIVTVAELIADGCSRHVLRRLVGEGLVVRVHDGVYRLASAPDTFEARCVAACAADGEAFVTGIAAARLWGARSAPRVAEPIVLVAHDRTPMATGVVVRRSNRIDESDMVERTDGIRVASPPRTWFDCARDVDDGRFEALTEWVLDQHTTLPTLWRLTQRMESRGRPGLARVHRVMSRRADWQRPAGSRLELQVLRALERRKVGPLVRQYPIELPNGITIHADGAVPDFRWAVEVDHVTWHGGRLDAQRDKGRDRLLRRIRWQVDRVTDQELTDDFRGAIDDLVACFEARRAEFLRRRVG